MIPICLIGLVLNAGPQGSCSGLARLTRVAHGVRRADESLGLVIRLRRAEVRSSFLPPPRTPFPSPPPPFRTLLAAMPPLPFSARGAACRAVLGEGAGRASRHAPPPLPPCANASTTRERFAAGVLGSRNGGCCPAGCRARAERQQRWRLLTGRRPGHRRPRPVLGRV